MLVYQRVPSTVLPRIFCNAPTAALRRCLIATAAASQGLGVTKKRVRKTVNQSDDFLRCTMGIYSYGHLSVITGYKWDYKFYKWGFALYL